jgi:tRNA threonylcarbamoyladenosine modification (KEOPS) complex  Pcc1 subunit
MTHTVTFSIPFPTQRDADIILKTLSPEAAQQIPRSEIDLKTEGTTLILRIGSDDLSSLRAACNSYLRWIQTAISVKDLI